MALISYGLSEVGNVRSENQDRILADDALGLFVVCDGIGGRRRGAIAAQLAIDVVRRYIEASRDPMDVTWPFGFDIRKSVAANRLMTAVRLANRQVWLRSEESIENLGMGTTIAAVLHEYSSIAVANVGDSRVYLVRGRELRQLTVDDTVGSSAPRGEEALGPTLRNVLTSAVGSHENVEVHLGEFELAEGNLLVVSSDGLHGVVGQDRMSEVIGTTSSPEETARGLIAAAHDAGSRDNVSVIVARWKADGLAGQGSPGT